MDPVIETNDLSILTESLREANKKIDEKDLVIEELKTQCEIVTSEIKNEWKFCLDEKLIEIEALKVIKYYLKFF